MTIADVISLVILSMSLGAFIGFRVGAATQ
jgi:hypothetical protein